MTLSPDRIRQLISPYLIDSIDDVVVNQLGSYLDLLIKWNAKTNLTAIREPEEIVRQHFGESLFVAQILAQREFNVPDATMMDFGSGGGFPGVPVQILLTSLHVTLAESQSKKVAFLREVVRTLGLSATVYAGRVEDMPEDVKFECITMRAVDNMQAAIAGALPRLVDQGMMAVLTTMAQREIIMQDFPDIYWHDMIPIPETEQRILLLGPHWFSPTSYIPE